MKRVLLLGFFFILSLTLMAQSDSIYSVETPIFKVKYSYTKEQPLVVEYSIDCPNGKVERRGDFWTDERYHTSDGYDYVDNVWDKGHLAPAATFSCTEEDLRQTFSYLNCALQHESLNRGVWARLEEFERNLANFYDVRVLIELEFDERCEVLSTGATVPRGFWKTIYWDNESVTFYFPNVETVNAHWTDFILTEIED